jgi:hypothetical protein
VRTLFHMPRASPTSEHRSERVLLAWSARRRLPRDHVRRPHHAHLARRRCSRLLGARHVLVPVLPVAGRRLAHGVGPRCAFETFLDLSARSSSCPSSWPSRPRTPAPSCVSARFACG